MLTMLNNYQHGWVAVPVILACKRQGLFDICHLTASLPFDALVEALRANSGHLRVALHLLTSLQWLSHDDADRYALRPASELHRYIPEDITSLLAFPMRDYVSGDGDPLSIARWVELSGQRWGIQEPTMAHFLDGLLMIPLLLALRERRLALASDPCGTALFAALPAVAHDEIIGLFAGKGWLDQADRPRGMGGPALNDAGRFMIERSLITAAVASYRPMLMEMDAVLFGDCTAIFRRDAAGQETHVDRTLNVVGSGFQHERYFEQMAESILAIFNWKPYERQPRYVADMGCGDGTLLRKIYDLIKQKSVRGQVLEQYPITLIGVDYNAQALEATARTLHGYDHLLLQGDIGNPSRLIEDLRAYGIHDPEHILHVRSFLDHDRPYKPPLDHAAAQSRADIPYYGVYVDRDGSNLPPATVMQSLVEHLRDWASIIGHHGLMMLEVHCLQPKTIARFMTQCESLHMDAYHRFSQQLLVESEHFIMAAAEVGLFPDWTWFRKYPARQPYTRITLSYLRKRDYTVRHPSTRDIPALVALERRGLPASQAASVEAITQRLAHYPDGQCLLEVDGQLAAVAYSQRVTREVAAGERADAAQPPWAHARDGAVAELLYALCPDAEHTSRGRDLIAFMTHWLPLKDGIEEVIGVVRCERSLERSNTGWPGMMAKIRESIHGYAIGPEMDPRAPEADLSAFGTRWLLRIFQEMGVMTKPDHVYDMPDLMRSLGILPKYERLWAALMRLLARARVLHVSGERVQVMPKVTTFALRDVEAECARFAADFRNKYPSFQPWLVLMYRCLGQFAHVLTGRIEATDVVFPNGSMDLFAGIFHGHDVADSGNRLVAEIVLAGIMLARQQAPTTSVSILEVGAGTGATTRVVLEKVQHLASVLSFDYTDTSSAFTRHGEKTFGQQFPWVRFLRLNIEDDLIAQGFQPETFDIVYAANSLHDTRHIAHTLAQIQALLKPGGLLIVNEFTAMKDVLLLTGGLLRGYWQYEDVERRVPDSCLLSVESWQAVLAASAFQHVEALGLPSQGMHTGQHVIVGAKHETNTMVVGAPQSIPALSQQDCAANIAAAVREIIGPQRAAALAPDAPFMETGLDSMELLDLRLLLSTTFGVELDATFLFQHNTLQKVCAFLQQQAQPMHHENNNVANGVKGQATNAAVPTPSPTVQPYRQGDMAIIGVAVRLPGNIHTLDDFWTLLQTGTTVVGPMPEARRRWPSGLTLPPDKPYLAHGGFLQRIDAFDAAFFRISPREAELLDPQQRILLELCWETLEDAGYKPSALSGSATGVFIGACHFDYRRLLEEQGLASEAMASTGTSGSILANRLSYFYNLQGPSMVVDTACSSSLMAVHEAVRALRDGSCELALAGGVNLICHPVHSVAYDQAGMLSRDGTCYTFDARANGYVRGEGAALVLLKRLDRAMRDNDQVYAVIKGSAANHGGQASSLTAPNPEAQARLLVKAWRDAEVTADSVNYIEAHGTGTRLGDPIEVEGIRQALALLRPGGVADYACGLGSVKANIGHLEAAAGIAGLLKVLLCLQHRTLPVSANFQTLNPEITLTEPLYIVDRTRPWSAAYDGAGRALPRRAGVSAFGFGGANAHVVLEEISQEARDHPVLGPYLFVLSARNHERLVAYAQRFLAFLERPEATALSLASLTYTLQHGREEMDERLAILCSDLPRLREQLQRFCAGQAASGNLYHGNAHRSAAEYALLTSGPAGCSFIENLIRDQDYERLALLWIRGARIDWPALFGHQPPGKVRLPTYPFADERYWVSNSTDGGGTPPSAAHGREPPPSEPLPRLREPESTVAEQADPDPRTLLLTPVWASMHDLPSLSSRLFPAATECVLLVESDPEHDGKASAAYGHVIDHRYPGCRRLAIRTEDSVDDITTKLEALAGELGGSIDHIFWIAPGPHADSVSILDQPLIADQQRGVLSLFRLIKALLRAGYGDRTLGWTVITMQAQPIHRYEHVDPTHAGIHGLMGVLAKECRRWKLRIVDLETPRAADGHVAVKALDDLLTLPPHPEGNAWACRGGIEAAPRWFRQKLVPVVFPASSSSLYRQDGVYVVIGGAGGIGEVWSEYMIRTYAARLVWINRRPREADVQGKLDRLAALGPAPLYISADAGDAAALRRAYEEIKSYHEQINGVVHAAVVLLDQALANMDEARFRAALAAKVETSIRMAQVFQQEPLDFVLFFSSIMTFLQAAGQSNYATGCAFQDAFAHQLGREWSRCEGGPVVKVMNWGYWGGVGVVASKDYRQRMAKMGFGSIDAPEAMAAVEALLAGPVDRLALVKTTPTTGTRAVEELPFFNRIDRSERITVAPETQTNRLVLDHLTRHPNRPSTSMASSAGDQPADRILAEVRRAASHALNIAPTDLDLDGDLHEYGFDRASLASMTQQLNRAYGLDHHGLPREVRPLVPSEVLECRRGQAPTLRGLAGFLMNEYGDIPRQAFPTSPAHGIDGDIEALLVKLLWGQLRAIGVIGEAAEVISVRGWQTVYDRWLQASLAMLIEHQVLPYESGPGAVHEGPATSPLPVEVDALWQEWDRKKHAWLVQSHQQASLTLVEATLHALPDILTGRQRATDVLFPNGSMQMVEGIYQHNTVADYFNTVLADTVVAYVQALAAEVHQRGAAGSPCLRLLEIGAGTGGTSAMLLHKLRDYQDNIEEYCYTDISRAFLSHAEDAYGRDYPYLTYQRFDVEQHLVGQGIDVGAYDLVIAANVLHATKDIRYAVRNAKACLKAGGLLLLNEISRNCLFYHLTFGLLEGWWRHEDEEWRLPGCPALSPQAWQEVLALEGFAPVIFPAQEAHDLGQQVIVAASDGVICQRLLPTATDTLAIPPQRQKTRPSASGPAARATDLAAYVHTIIRDCLARSLKTPAVGIDGGVPFAEYGLDSILTSGFIMDVNARLGIDLKQAIIFDHTTADRLTSHVVRTYGTDIGGPTQPQDDTGEPPRLCPDLSPARATDIAVIGMAGQFPDAGDVRRFWENLLAGRDCVHELPAHYLDQARDFSAEKQAGKTYCRWGGILHDRDCFDPLFFNISPREARSMSPHQRLILQESWKSLEDAGYNPRDLAGARVGVFIGAEPAGYVHKTFTGASDALIASRLSYYLNLHGPAMVVNTGCSSSGVALHLACESLRHGESSLALAGGVFVLTDASLLSQLCAMDMLSRTGRCHTFDVRGDGMVVSEGVGVVVLKRLAEAVADGDPILGVIVASGVNQDGASNGITAPSGAAQEELLTSVYERFRIDPAEIGYVEAHGTGTRLGDPVEANALVRAFQRFTAAKGFCAVGSAKAAIGHTAASAGVVGLIKVLLSFKHRTLPGLLGLEQLNPLIEFDNSPFYVTTRPQPWRGLNGKPLLAAMNCFGHSGTNVHLVIQEHPSALEPPGPTANGTTPTLIPLSARTAERLSTYAEYLGDFLASPAGRDLRLADVAHTLQVGREAMQERVLFLVRDIPELAAKLQDFAAGRTSLDGCWTGRVVRSGGALRCLGEDGSGDDVFARSGASGQYEKIAQWWTRGGVLDWCRLGDEGHGAGCRPHRISLPTYPFAKERYWIADRAEPAPSASQLLSLPADSATMPPVVQAISTPLPIEDTWVAHILAHGELLNDDMDDLLGQLFWGILQAMGLCRESTLTWSQFESIAGIDKKFGRWLAESLDRLVDLGYLVDGRGGCRVLDPRPVDMDALWRVWEQQKAIWSQDAHKTTQVALADATLRHLPDILTGRRKVTDFLFPNSSMELVQGIYRHNLVADFFNEALVDVLVTYVEQRMRRRPSDGPLQLRLLEIGAGTGGTTAAILPRLQPYCDHIQEYCFTDVSNTFLSHAQRQYADGYPFLTTHLFDMEMPTAELTLDRDGYDVVIATNAVHAARHVRQPLRNVKALLKHHGLLLLNELSCKPKPLFIHLSLALLDGWWLYEDAELRIPGCPGLWPHTWERVLHEEGFPSVFFPVAKAHVLGQQIVMAENDAVAGPRQHDEAGTLRQRSALPLAPGEGTETRPQDQPDVGLPKTVVASSRFEEHVQATILDCLSKFLELDSGRIDVDAPFADYGLDSIAAVNLVEVLNQALSLAGAKPSLTTTTIFDHCSVNQLTVHLVSQYASVIATALTDAAVAPYSPEPKGVATLSAPPGTVAKPSSAPATGLPDHTDAIAIVGMSGRFPGSDTLEALWQHLIDGEDLVKEVSRWDLGPYFPGASPEHRTYCQHGSFLDHINQFDPLFFNISALEATYMDPQQRFFLEESWKALEEAGYAGDAVKGQRCGVYVGCVGGDYARLFREEPPAQAFWGNAGSIIPARIAYYLDLQGPAIAVDTACSSSAVAIHLACQALRGGEIDMALAGGVYIQSTPELFVSGSQAGMLSLTGRCFSFDQRADGFVPGEGVGVLVLKRLGDAIADGDHIHGVIRGSGINQDGTTNGITAPSAKSQERLIREVYDRFAIDPAQIQMVEAHGTGTILGDPIEVEALTRAFRHYTSKEAYCALGTLKTNIGHTSMAAGVAGVLKILLALRHRQIPPSLNYACANPRIPFERSPFYVNTHARPWIVDENDTRCAVTSAFGFSGTNAHLVIAEAPRIERQHGPRPGYMCVLSARNAEQLRRRAEDLLAFCLRETGVDLGNMCYTLLLGRSHLDHRLACVVRDLAELTRDLRAWLDHGASSQVYVAEVQEGQLRQRKSLSRYGDHCLQACRQADHPGDYLEHLGTLADLYIQGYRLDFSQLFADGYSRLSLPTYPFAPESYWAPTAALPVPLGAPSAADPPSPLPLVAVHPLLHRNTSDFTVQRFSSRFSGREFFLDDHWINGHRVLPGVVHLEMARAAVAAAAGLCNGAGLCLHDVIWVHPVVVDAAVELHIDLVPDIHRNAGTGETEHIRYEIYTTPASGERLVHGQGIVSLSMPAVPPRLDLNGLRVHIDQDRLSAEQCYEAFRTLGIRHGPSLQGIEAVFRTDDQVLARLRPRMVSGDLVMHPMILDAALQTAFFLPREEDDSEIRWPFALEELALFRPGSTPAWAWLRHGDKAGELVVDLCDGQGNVCIRFQGLSLRTRAEKPATSQTLLLEPCWEEKPAGAITKRFDRHLIVLCGLDTRHQHAIETAFEGCRCLWLPATDQPIEKCFENYAIQLFETVRELLAQRGAANVLLQVVCPAYGAGRVFAALAGFLSIANHESPRIIGQMFEVDAATAELVDLLRESSGCPEDAYIRYWCGKRYVARWGRLDGDEHEAAIPWKDGGTYLITGGLGGLGQVVARHIAAHTQQASLILVGRSPLSPDKRVLVELQALGAQVEYRQVDVADAAQVDALMRDICRQSSWRAGGPGLNGPLQGIIHAAGVHHDRRLIEKSAAEFAQVLSPKVAGTANLDRATGDLHLDFFVLFSSLAVAMGNPGQADYVTANAFMDAYAAWRNGLVASGQRHGRTLSINWPLWQDGRMRADREVERMVTRRTGLVPMESSAGLHALVRSLAVGKDQVMVLHGDAPRLYAALAAPRPIPHPASHGTPIRDQQMGSPHTGRPDLQEQALDYFRKRIAALVQLPAHRLSVDSPLEQYGFDSILLMKMTTTLEDTFGTLPKTLLFEYQSIRDLTAYFLETYADKLDSLLAPDVSNASHYEPEASVGRTIAPDHPDGTTDDTDGSNCRARIPRRQFISTPVQAGVRAPLGADIAVVGLTGRYPRASNLAEFWDNLTHGKDCVTEIPEQRWDHAPYFDPEQDKPGKTACKWGGFIDGVDQFDPLFFNVSPRQAACMDPQERLFLETVWNLFEDIGYTREHLQQRYEGKVGVFVGAMYQHYHLCGAELDSAAAVALSSYSAIANRVSTFFDLQGPSLAVDTMCSSSLTAVHMACESLLRGECVLAVAGGVNLSLHPKKFVGLSRAGMAASRPDSRSFSAGDGYLPAEAVGAVLLKPLTLAVRDGDEILAVIKSTATNHSGSANGFAVPDPKAQAQVIIDNFAKAGIDPRTISYVEAAANGSPLGDTIEIAALNRAFATFTSDRAFCAIGSVKSNLGHPEAASGMAQLAKVILQLRHGQLVPSIKAAPLNPNISFADTPFILQETCCAWQRPRLDIAGPDGRLLQQEIPRRAGINSFGAGGSNAHLIIEEYIVEPQMAAVQSTPVPAPQIMVISAKNRERLRAVVQQLRDFLLTAEPSPALADLAYTLQIGREPMPARLALVVWHRRELLQGLAAFLQEPRSLVTVCCPMFMGNPDEDQDIDNPLVADAVYQALLRERHPDQLARYWARGGEIPWEALYEGEHPRLIHLPTYPFARQRYWLVGSVEAPQAERAAEPPAVPEAPTGTAADRVRAFLLRFLGRELHLTVDQINPHRDLRSYGADSITALRLIRAIEHELHIQMSGRDLLEHHTLQTLASYLDSRMVVSEVEGTRGIPRDSLQDSTPDAFDAFMQGRLTLEEMEALLAQGEMV